MRLFSYENNQVRDSRIKNSGKTSSYESFNNYKSRISLHMNETLLELSKSFLERFGEISFDTSVIKGRDDIDATLVLEENGLVGVWVFDQWSEVQKDTIERVLQFIPDTNLAAIIIIANKIEESAREYGECKANIFMMERSDLSYAIDKSERKEKQKTMEETTRNC